MRELKFRVYIPDHEKFSYFGLNEFDYSDRYLYQHKYHVQQYTGLEDSKRVPIYEGDIIEGLCLSNGPSRAVVGFDTFGIFYTDIKKYGSDPYENCLSMAQEYSEVIGNICENPELLK